MKKIIILGWIWLHQRFGASLSLFVKSLRISEEARRYH